MKAIRWMVFLLLFSLALIPGPSTYAEDVDSLVVTDNGNVGIGTTAPLSRLEVVDRKENESASGLNVNLTLSGSITGEQKIQRGILVNIEETAKSGTQTDGSKQYIHGLVNSITLDNEQYFTTGNYNWIQNQNQALSNHIRGDYNYILQNSGTIENAFGEYNYVRNLSGTIGEAYGNYSQVRVDEGVVTNSYVYSAKLDRNAGTATNGYLFKGDIDGSFANKWGLYLTDEEKNYLSGNLGVGVSSPTNKLHIRGADSDGYLVRFDSGEANGTRILFQNDFNTIAGFCINTGGSDGSRKDRFNFYAMSNAAGDLGQRIMTFTSDGNVGIKKDPNSSYALDVNGAANVSGALKSGSFSTGSVTATSISTGSLSASNPSFGTVNTSKVIASGSITCSTLTASTIYGTLGGSGGPDYVFEPDYELPTLESIAAYVKEHRHLPEVPSAAEMEADGINISQMVVTHLKRIEELTLHAIALKAENDQLKKVIEELGSRIDRIEAQAALPPGESLQASAGDANDGQDAQATD